MSLLCGLNNKRGNAILVVMVIVGILFVAGIIYISVTANKEASKEYEKMIHEALESDPDEGRFGEGVMQDFDIVKKEYKSTKKPKPIIYVNPGESAKSK